MSFSPFTYLFSLIYGILICIMLSINSFYTYWFIIELLMLVLIGISYSIIINKISSIITYFFIQSLASFLLLITYMYSLQFLFSVALVLNLGMFPFMFWYLNSVTQFPGSVFFFASTLHKVPPLFILAWFDLHISHSVMWFSMILSVLLSGALMVATTDIRLLLVASSVGNNSWILLANEVGPFMLIQFLSLYAVCLGLVLAVLGGLHQPNLLFHNGLVYYAFFNLSGLPPLSMFFVNIAIITFFVDMYGLMTLLVLFLLSSSLMVASYITYLISNGAFVYSFSSVYSLEEKLDDMSV